MKNTMKSRAEKVLRYFGARWDSVHNLKKSLEAQGDEQRANVYLQLSCEISGAELLLKAIIDNDTEFIDKMCEIYGVK